MRCPSRLTATDTTWSLMAGEPVDDLAGFQVPDHHGVVLGPRDDSPAVGGRRHRAHGILMPGQPVELATGLQVPHDHGPVKGP